MFHRLRERTLQCVKQFLVFLATPLGFNVYAMVMYSDPAMLALFAVGVQRAARRLIELL